MKAAVFTGEPGLSLQERPIPQLCVEEALIRVQYAGICGSDIYICSGKNPRIRPPVIPGHEFVGEIVEIVSRDFAVGQRVVVEPLLSCGRCCACMRGDYHVCASLRLLGVNVDGGFAQYVKVPIHRMTIVPDQLSLRKAVLVEPLAVALHGLRQAHLEIRDNVVVMGGGPVGLLLAQVARLAGARVMVSEIGSFRQQLAATLGFEVIDATTNPVEQVLELTNGQGADVVYEVVGSLATSTQMCQMCRIKGQVVVVGLFKELASVDLLTLGFREQTIRGSRVYNYDDYGRALDLLAQDRINTEALITHEFPLEEIAKGMEIAQKAETGVKVLILPN